MQVFDLDVMQQLLLHIDKKEKENVAQPQWYYVKCFLIIEQRTI